MAVLLTCQDGEAVPEVVRAAGREELEVSTVTVPWRPQHLCFALHCCAAYELCTLLRDWHLGRSCSWGLAPPFRQSTATSRASMCTCSHAAASCSTAVRVAATVHAAVLLLRVDADDDDISSRCRATALLPTGIRADTCVQDVLRARCR
jgi:hypothetical protein